MPAEDGQGPVVSFSGRRSDSPTGAALQTETTDDASGGTSDLETGDAQPGGALADLERQAAEAATRAERARKDYANLQPEYTRATQERDRYRQEADAFRRQNETLQQAVAAYQRSPEYSTDEGADLTSALGKQVSALSDYVNKAVNQQQADSRVLAQSVLRALENDQRTQMAETTNSVREKVRTRFGSFEPTIENYLVEVWQSGDPDRLLEVSEAVRKAASERAAAETRSNVSRQNDVAAPDIGSRTRSARNVEPDYKEILRRHSDSTGRLAEVLKIRLENLHRKQET